MVLVYTYNIQEPGIDFVVTEESEGVSKVSYTFVRSVSAPCRENTGLEIYIEGTAVKGPEEEFFTANDTYTIYKKSECGKYRAVIVESFRMISLATSDGITVEGRYKSFPDDASIRYNNETGKRTIKLK